MDHKKNHEDVRTYESFRQSYALSGKILAAQGFDFADKGFKKNWFLEKDGPESLDRLNKVKQRVKQAQQKSAELSKVQFSQQSQQKSPNEIEGPSSELEKHYGPADFAVDQSLSRLAENPEIICRLCNHVPLKQKTFIY